MGLDIKSVIADTSDQGGDGAVWVEYPDADGVRFKLAYLGNDDYQDYVAERMNRARRGRRDIPSDKSRGIIVDGLLRFVLKGWEGIENHGVAFDFTPENAKLFLKQSPIIRDFIITEANNIENFGGGDQKDAEEDTPQGVLKRGSQVDASVGA